MKVGIIGHIGNSHVSLAAAIAKLGHELVDITETGLQRSDRLPDLVLGESPYCEPDHGRAKDPVRKAARKARMREAQRKAFLG